MGQKMPSGHYECVRCKNTVPPDAVRVLTQVKCPTCGYRVLRRLSPNEYAKEYLDSYDGFLASLQSEIDKVGGVEPKTVVRSSIRFGKINVDKPKIVEADGSDREIYPLEARIRNLSYAAPLQLEMWVERHGRKRTAPDYAYIGDIPIMVKSKKCRLSEMTEEELLTAGEDPKDPGGYFIIRGVRMVIHPDVFSKALLEAFQTLCQDIKNRASKAEAKTARTLGRITTAPGVVLVKPRIMTASITHAFDAMPIRIVRWTATEDMMFGPT
ncbi:MAG: hypothetical protein ACE5PO_04415 [Candidatus Bathyarchaeia archaeon]